MRQPVGESNSKRLRLDSVGTQTKTFPWNQLVESTNSTQQAIRLEPRPRWRKLSRDSIDSITKRPVNVPLNAATDPMFGTPWTSGQGFPSRFCYPVDMDIEKNDESTLQNFHSPLNSVTEFPILSS